MRGIALLVASRLHLVRVGQSIFGTEHPSGDARKGKRGRALIITDIEEI